MTNLKYSWYSVNMVKRRKNKKKLTFLSLSKKKKKKTEISPNFTAFWLIWKNEMTFLTYTHREEDVLSNFFPQISTKNGVTTNYSLIAFDERVTFWLQRVRSLPCACAYVALFARRLAYNHYAIAQAYNAANTHAQGSDPARWSQKVTLSSKAIGV